MFRTEFDNQQYYIFDGSSGSQGLLNIDTSRASGGELELQALVGNGFRLLASLGITETEILELEAQPDYVGNKSPNVDRLTANLGVHHRKSFAGGRRLTTRADYRHVGKRYWHVDNDADRNPLDLIDLRLSYGGSSWSLGAYVKNATDEAYSSEFIAGQFAGLPYGVRFPALPRTYGLEFQKRF